MANSFNLSSYCRNQPEFRISQPPIIALRAPTTNDIGYALGSLWIEPKNTSNVAVNSAWILTSVINNSATWQNISGGAGSFSSLTVVGATTLTGLTNINTTGAAVTNIGVGGTGAVNLGNATGNTTISAGNLNVANGNLALQTVGNKLQIATAANGVNASAGTSAAMVGGIVTIATTAVTSSSIILVSHDAPGGTLGTLYVSSITAGTSFVVTSTNVADTSTVNFLIIN